MRDYRAFYLNHCISEVFVIFQPNSYFIGLAISPKCRLRYAEMPTSLRLNAVFVMPKCRLRYAEMPL